MDEIAQGVYVETEYEGVNVGAVVTSQGIICIDVPSYPADARHWATQVNRLSARSVRYVVLTDAQGDRILNSRWLGAPLIAQQNAAETIFGYEKRYPQTIIESLGQRNRGASSEITAVPVDYPAVSFSKKMTIMADDRRITILKMVGPSSGNAWIYLPETALLFTGDSVVVDCHPYHRDPIIRQWIKRLSTLEDGLLDVKTLIPGRGAVVGLEAVRVVREYLEKLLDDVVRLIESGGSRDQVGRRAALFMHEFPAEDLPFDWVYRQVSRSLLAIYDELQADASTIGQGNGNPASSSKIKLG